MAADQRSLRQLSTAKPEGVTLLPVAENTILVVHREGRYVRNSVGRHDGAHERREFASLMESLQSGASAHRVCAPAPHCAELGCARRAQFVAAPCARRAKSSGREDFPGTCLVCKRVASVSCRAAAGPLMDRQVPTCHSGSYLPTAGASNFQAHSAIL